MVVSGDSVLDTKCSIISHITLSAKYFSNIYAIVSSYQINSLPFALLTAKGLFRFIRQRHRSQIGLLSTIFYWSFPMRGPSR